MKETMDNVATRISSFVKEYTEEVLKQMEDELERTADEVLKYVQENCPRGESDVHLADTFVKTETGYGSGKIIYISSYKKGRLVHLIEFGFKHRNGKQVAARPFMRPAYETFSPKMLENIRKIIKGEKVGCG